MVDMFVRLNKLHFVYDLVVEGTALLGQALPETISAGNAFKPLSGFSRFSSILTMETYTAPRIQSIPPPSVPPLPTSDPLPSNTIQYPPDAGLDFDWAIQDHGIMDPSTSPPSVPNTVDAGTPVIASLQSIDRPTEPDAGPASYPTPSTHDVNSPAVGRQPASPSSLCSPQVYQAVNTPEPVSTPYSTSAAAPAGLVNTPGADVGVSSYPTPSTNYANSPRVDEPARDQTIVRLLQSCTLSDENVRLGNIKIRNIIKAGPSLLPQDPFEILRPLLDNSGNTFSSLEKLGLPEEWEGINGAVNYFRVLDRDKDEEICLDPLARRVAQILLHLNYASLYSRDKYVLRRILEAYNDDPTKSESEKSRRNRFTTYHARLGKWWWRLAANLGFGILLVADDLAKEMYVARAAHYGLANSGV